MDNRLQLHEELCSLLGSDHVYFQPPENVKLIYPCFVYSLNNYDVKHADNKLYQCRDCYEVIYIDRNPDNTMKKEFLMHFQLCRFNRPYTADNLNHYVFTLYY